MFPAQYLFGSNDQSSMSLETKSAIANTKRRKYTTMVAPGLSFARSRMDALSTRVTRLTKSLKAQVPNHVYSDIITGLATFSTTGGILNLCNNITQGRCLSSDCAES